MTYPKPINDRNEFVNILSVGESVPTLSEYISSKIKKGYKEIRKTSRNAQKFILLITEKMG